MKATIYQRIVKEGKDGVIITRSKLSDGNNYYLTLVTISDGEIKTIIEKAIQGGTILSERKAIREAKKYLASISKF